MFLTSFKNHDFVCKLGGKIKNLLARKQITMLIK